MVRGGVGSRFVGEVVVGARGSRVVGVDEELLRVSWVVEVVRLERGSRMCAMASMPSITSIAMSSSKCFIATFSLSMAIVVSNVRAVSNSSSMAHT